MDYNGVHDTQYEVIVNGIDESFCSTVNIDLQEILRFCIFEALNCVIDLLSGGM